MQQNPTSYRTVLEAVVGINLVKVRNQAQFSSVSTKVTLKARGNETIPLGYGYVNMMGNYLPQEFFDVSATLVPSSSKKGYKVQTSYPTYIYK